MVEEKEFEDEDTVEFVNRKFKRRIKNWPDLSIGGLFFALAMIFFRGNPGGVKGLELLVLYGVGGTMITAVIEIVFWGFARLKLRLQNR